MNAFKLLSVLALISGSVLAAEPQLPKQYRPFQGRWKVVGDIETPPINLRAPEVLIDVVGQSFVLHGDSVTPNYRRSYEFRVPGDNDTKPYHYLHAKGVGDLADLVEIPNQITVFWFVGIYRFSDDRLELAWKYCGQGVEGEAAKRFRPPSSFDRPVDGRSAVIVLERVEASSDDLLTEDKIDG